jgi:tRNA (guanine37-N1)-methyltransferase
MHISILTVFPELYHSFLQTSLVGRAQHNNLISCDVRAFSDFCKPKERIDAPTFGHGAGMLIRPEVIERAVDAQDDAHGKAFKIFFSPQGKVLTQYQVQHFAHELQKKNHVMLVAARYEGMDARVEEEYADALVSVGDFVLMGGDIPAMMVLEALLRHIPGVVGRQESVQEDSFTGPFFDYPEYTAPVVWKEREVPAVVRSGNHGQLRAWRQNQAVTKTIRERFDWVRSVPMSCEQRDQVIQQLPPHYVVLMHDQVVVGGEHPEIGTTSVTSLDIHDIARSATTYGLKNYFIVTPLIDQQKIVQRLLDFWLHGVGVAYNPHRHESLKLVQLCSSLDEVLFDIAKKHDASPIIIATSARKYELEGRSISKRLITYHDQAQIWAFNRPVLIVLGTGQGLSQECINRCDYVLVPIEGFSDFNHLSVRSAAAIIFDRWLGSTVKCEKTGRDIRD